MIGALLARFNRGFRPGKASAEAASRAVPEEAGTPPELPEPEPEPESDHTGNAGLRSASLHGWFDDVGHVLHPGFPIGPDDVVADISCGDGGIALFCARQGAAVILADIDAPRLQAARARLEAVAPGRITALETNSDPIPLADGSVTRVICTEVIEHVDDPAVLLRELYRIAAPGGRLLLTCPDPRSEQIQKMVASPIYFEKPNHVRIIATDELEQMTRDAGFVIEHRDTYGFFWTVWWSLFWGANVEFGKPHPLLDGWARIWSSVLDLPDGPVIQRALDDALPKSQLLVARRPDLTEISRGDH